MSELILPNLPVLGLVDFSFIGSHAAWGFDACADGVKPTLFEWSRDLNGDNDIVVFTDKGLTEHHIRNVKANKKIGLIIEPWCIDGATYRNILHIENELDLILTYDDQLLQRGSKYAKYVIGSCRIAPHDRKIHSKTKDISIIASHKRWTRGHKLRHEIIGRVGDKLDAWGHDYRKLDNKIHALRDYRFSICVINEQINNYFTEILVDCILTGGVPIFWGCPNVSEYFDIRGLLQFNSIEELEMIVSNTSEELYAQMLPYLEKNFELAKDYISTDDYVYKTIKGRIG
jgi:hypothetical protein